MGVSQESDGPILLIEPDINAVSRRFGLPAVANYPPLAQVRLAGQIDDPRVHIVDLRIPESKSDSNECCARVRRRSWASR